MWPKIHFLRDFSDKLTPCKTDGNIDRTLKALKFGFC